MTREITEKRFLRLVKGNGGNPLLHKNLAFYERGPLIGAVVLDLVDLDYGWIVLCRKARTFWVVDVEHSLPTKEAARAALLSRLEKGEDCAQGPALEQLDEALRARGARERVEQFYASGEHELVVRAWAYRRPLGTKH